MTLFGEPVIVVLQPAPIVVVDPGSGALRPVSVLDHFMRAHDGRAVRVPDDFSSAPTAGWSAALDAGAGELVIRDPEGSEFYQGTFIVPTGQSAWRRAVSRADSIVVVTGAMTDLAGLESVLLRGSAQWIRAELTAGAAVPGPPRDVSLRNPPGSACPGLRTRRRAVLRAPWSG